MNMNMKSLAQSLLKQNYHVTHLYHRYRLRWQGRQTPEKIIVYQMGKVGSTSVWKSLEALHLNIPIYHVHGMTHQSVAKQIQKSQERFKKLRSIYYEISHAEYLRHQLDHQKITSPWQVITLVRDPIAQTLSSFFQALEMKFKLGTDESGSTSHQAQEQLLNYITQSFYDRYVNNPDRDHPFAWFNQEMKTSLGIDVFSEASSPRAQTASDYYIFSGAIAHVLLLKLESLNEVSKQAFQDFLGIENFTLITSNLGTQKRRYGSLYKEFTKRVALPESYLDRMYRSPMVKAFYSDAEIDGFYRRWRSA